MKDIRVIALTHRQFPLDTIGAFYIAPEHRSGALQGVRTSAGIQEFMYLATCNRVELVFTLDHYVCPGLTAKILSGLRPDLPETEIREIAQRCDRYNGPEAVEHLLRVASSLESVVIGEREIITQLRSAYEECRSIDLTGDDLRLLIGQCVRTAKEIFTHTDLARKPVSVVSLAWQQFRAAGIRPEHRVLLVGAGQIIRNFSKFLAENGYHNVTVANRTLNRAGEIARTLQGKAISLDQLHEFGGGFDALVTCTGAEYHVIPATLYEKLLAGEKDRKCVIDLALPADVAPEATESFDMVYIGMDTIREQASKNLEFREKALEDCVPLIEQGVRDFERAWHERQVERAMKSIPEAIKEIRSTALGSVFADELGQLDAQSREVLEKIILYMEKKYISVPMKMAREVLLDAVSRN